ncbi:MAG: cadherin domain-containing protein [Planctomycetota bacterium]
MSPLFATSKSQFKGRNRKAKQRNKRILKCEKLEMRRVLAAAINDPYWESLEASEVDLTSGDSLVQALDYELFSMKSSEVEALLKDVPGEFEYESLAELPVISIPAPDGSVESYRFAETSVMAPELAAKFPSFQTFVGQGVDDPTATIRFDVTSLGFNAIVNSGRLGHYITEPYFAFGNHNVYASYSLGGQFEDEFYDFKLGAIEIEEESFAENEDENDDSDKAEGEEAAGRSNGNVINVYRAAIATTGEYTALVGGTVEGGMARVVTEVNRVNSVYEIEVATRIELVANNDQLIYTDQNNDPYTGDDLFAQLGENQRNVDTVIGTANYDVGHVLSTPGGGLAYVGVIGNPVYKAGGASGEINNIVVTLHELGHMFGSNHTWNGDGGGCSARNHPSFNGAQTAAEPGAGTTIMSYAGLCGDQNIQRTADLYFHAVSFEAILDHTGSIPNVGTKINSGNSVPFVDAGRDYVIPAHTPFVLSVTASDADADDVLTFTWDQRDIGVQQDVNLPDDGQSPLFRSFPASEATQRFFPQISDILNNTQTRGERLPSTTRELNFSAVARDSRIGAGGVALDNVRLNVINTGSGFEVTNFDTPTTLNGFSRETITWDAAGTTAAPISASHVDVFFSVDGGNTYPIEVATELPNTGSATIVVPNAATNDGRFMVRGHDNVFFDINDASIQVIEAPVDLDLGTQTSTYVEDQVAVPVAPAATFSNPSNVDMDGVTVAISVLNSVPGDQIELRTGGLINLSGSSISYNGVTVGELSGSGDNMSIQFESAASMPAVQDLIRNVTYRNTTDNPTALTRQVNFSLGANLNDSITVDVVPVNDSPVLADVMLTPIIEDSATLTGDTVESLLTSAFSDVDEGSSASGLAVVRNIENLSQGQWFYSTNNGNTWAEVGEVFSISDSIVLPPTAMLGFAPAMDFQGTPTPLGVRGLDNTYDGSYSAGSAVALESRHLLVNGAASVAISDVGIHVVNVNDPPVANVLSYEHTFRQDEVVDLQFPANSFTDIDDPNLAYDLTGRQGRSLPVWINFDPSTRTMSGIPQNRDVGSYLLDLIATDSEGERAIIPVTIHVENVNDPPTQVTLSTREIAENFSGRPVGRVSAQDPDVNDNLTWNLSDDRFTVVDNELILLEDLDYEQEQVINLLLTVTDDGNPPLATSLAIGIEVLNENEFLPELESQDFELTSGMLAGTLVADLDAVDQDFGDTVSYSLKGDDAGAFNLDPVTGELSLAADLDYVRQDYYRIFVESSDDGMPINSTLVQFNLHVVPINNFAPTMPNPQFMAVGENSAAGTVVGTLEATDQDGNVLEYEIVESNEFVVDPATGEVTVAPNANLDFETQSSYEFIARVREDVEPYRTAISTVTVSVENVNDAPTGVSLANPNAPAFRQGIDLGELVVDDQDGTPTTYTFSSTDPRFEFTGNTMRLIDAGFFTASDVGDFTVDLMIVDDMDPTNYSVVPLTFNVFDAAPWTNLANNLDVNRDGAVSGLDALELINELNVSGSRLLSSPRSLVEQDQNDWDVNQDGSLTAIDALIAINYLNTGGAGEGEAYSAPPEEAAWLDAFEELEDERRRRNAL